MVHASGPSSRPCMSNMDMVLSKTDIASPAATPNWSRTKRTCATPSSRASARNGRPRSTPCCQITGATELLSTNPLLARSIRNRFPYIEPLNHLQVELLRRFRSGNRHERTRGIHLTINGVAAGLRNSGRHELQPGRHLRQGESRRHHPEGRRQQGRHRSRPGRLRPQPARRPRSAHC
jgi:phosphoenolpyruvate carboxylase